MNEPKISGDKGSHSEKSEMRLSMEKVRGVELGYDLVKLRVFEIF